MKWERWPGPNVGQIYEVEECTDEELQCMKGDEVVFFHFVAEDAATLAAFKSCSYVRVAGGGIQPTPVRPVEGGWEIWKRETPVAREHA
ncbi:MAG: hypothetical protein WD716_12800 [Fimbriimonadaceae bacterium]